MKISNLKTKRIKAKIIERKERIQAETKKTVELLDIIIENIESANEAKFLGEMFIESVNGLYESNRILEELRDLFTEYYIEVNGLVKTRRDSVNDCENSRFSLPSAGSDAGLPEGKSVGAELESKSGS